MLRKFFTRSFRMLFAPAWMSENINKAEEAVAKINNQTTLQRIVKESDTSSVVDVAAARLTDQSILSLLEQGRLDPWRLRRLVEKLSDQDALSEIARHDEDDSVREAAAEKLTDQSVLAEIFRHDENDIVRRIAVKKLSNQHVLGSLMLEERDQFVIKPIMKRITDRSLLAKILKKAKAPEARWCACELLNKNHTWQGCFCSICGYDGNHSWDGRSRTEGDQFEWTDYCTCSRCGKERSVRNRRETGDYDYARIRNYPHFMS